jgi:hypothetical protein
MWIWVRVADAMDIWSINLLSAEWLDRSWVDIDVCSPDRVQDGAGIIGSVNLRRVAMRRADTKEI